MSMWRTQRRQTRAFQGVPVKAVDMIPGRSSGGKHGTVRVNQDTAGTHSGVWAATRIRADMLSTFPTDVYRDLDFGDGPIPTVQAKSSIMVDPGGTDWDFVDWMWASQRDLDMAGNAIGIIRERSGFQTRYYPQGLPSVIELQDTRDCSVVYYKGKLQYRISGRLYKPFEVYHERQYPVSGSPIGLSTLQYAAKSIGEYLTLQDYGLSWFESGGVPKAWMKHTTKRLDAAERDTAKQWYQDTIRNGDLMVTGNDWEYNMIQSEQAGMEWLNGRRFGLLDIARFFGIPADMIDAAVSGQSVTYANITQRNLQFLIMNLGPIVARREKNLTKLLPTPRYMKFNTNALLRMDPENQQQILRSKLETWQITNAEARELEDRRKLQPEQVAEMVKLYGRPVASGQLPPAPPAAPKPEPAKTPAKQPAKNLDDQEVRGATPPHVATLNGRR
jgi:HK97 family phage portal protein